MGHRLQHHDGKCYMLHGHTYRMEAEFSFKNGEVQPWRDSDAPTGGMVEDFTVLKREVKAIVETMDHAMMLQEGDPCIEHVEAFSKVLEMPFPPTAELIANWLLLTIDGALHSSAECVRVRVWESDETWAEARGDRANLARV
jgi:6-pyruvoyltetrahydropterin/6-carboxytetrahydropterin synthase